VNPIVAPALVGVGLLVACAAAWQLVRARRERRVGRLVAADDGAGAPPVFASPRYRLRGRPDAVRRTRAGVLVPVEVKHREAPRAGPFASHRVQLEAYALLLEEATGRAPPFGVLRYRDRDVRLPWDDRARAELLALRAEVDRPYDGRATPSPARCGGCRWAPVCDRRAPGVLVRG
jgi:CRISPR-associated exonuclease Cas4